jgi:hypothetical protein
MSHSNKQSSASPSTPLRARADEAIATLTGIAQMYPGTHLARAVGEILAAHYAVDAALSRMRGASGAATSAKVALPIIKISDVTWFDVLPPCGAGSHIQSTITLEGERVRLVAFRVTEGCMGSEPRDRIAHEHREEFDELWADVSPLGEMMFQGGRYLVFKTQTG